MRRLDSSARPCRCLRRANGAARRSRGHHPGRLWKGGENLGKTQGKPGENDEKCGKPKENGEKWWKYGRQLEKFYEDMRKTWRIMMKRWKKKPVGPYFMGLCEKICQDKNGKRFGKREFLIFNV